MTPHRFNWRTFGRFTAHWCQDCGIPGVVTDPGECPGPPEGAPADYLAPARRNVRVAYRDGEPVIELVPDAATQQPSTPQGE